MNNNTNAFGKDLNNEPRPLDLEAGRRAFIRTCGLGVVGAALAGGAVQQARAATPSNIDQLVLNFALNLEYLEAEFYLRATRGADGGLPDSQIGGTDRPGGVKGGKKVNFDTRNVQLYAEEIAEDEFAHVRLLRSALGAKAVSRPAINLTDSFNAAATAAGLIPAGGTFDAFANETNFLLASFIFEDVGVTAYKGAAPLIQDKGTLETAAGILGVEAYHAGIIRTLLFSLGLFKEAAAISNARDSLDGRRSRDQGIGRAGKANLVPTDVNGVAYSRTVDQVKSIVYLSPTGDRGGFYPRGINGAFGPMTKQQGA